MFKRVRWMGMGAVAGVGVSTWAQRRLRRTLQEHPSIRTGADVVSTARRLRRELSAALADGRQAMSDREAALRSGMDARLGLPADDDPGRGPGRPALRIVDTTSGTPRPTRALAAPGGVGAPPAPPRPPGPAPENRGGRERPRPQPRRNRVKPAAPQ
jgi:hypothetical protein